MATQFKNTFDHFNIEPGHDSSSGATSSSAAVYHAGVRHLGSDVPPGDTPPQAAAPALYHDFHAAQQQDSRYGCEPFGGLEDEPTPLLAHDQDKSAPAADPGRQADDVGADARAGALLPPPPVWPLCAAHLLVSWAKQTWSFTAALVLLFLHPTSLALVSAYGLLDCLIRVLLSSSVGSYVDGRPRLAGARGLVAAQNLCIAASTAASLGAFLLLRGAPSPSGAPSQHGASDDSGADDGAGDGDGGARPFNHQLRGPAAALYWCLVGITILAGALSSIGSTGATIAVEKDWAQAMWGHEPRQLSIINSRLRGIDLGCQLLAPLASGVLMTLAGPVAAVACILAFTLAAWLPEAELLRRTHDSWPSLRRPRAKQQHLEPPHQPAPHEVAAQDDDDGTPSAAPQRAGGQLPPAGASAGRTPWPQAVAANVRAYLRQPALRPMLSLAMLYLNVLSLGFLMTAFLKWQGLSEAEVSAWRGGGALSGLAATVIFPPAAARLGLRRAGLVAISYQTATLAVGALPLLLIGRAGSSSGGGSGGGVGALSLVRLLVAMQVLSRTGLWIFDLCVMQIMQETVAEGTLGAVSGVQYSLSSVFETLTFVGGLMLPDPASFRWLMTASLAALFSAWGIYLSHYIAGDAIVSQAASHY